MTTEDRGQRTGRQEDKKTRGQDEESTCLGVIRDCRCFLSSCPLVLLSSVLCLLSSVRGDEDLPRFVVSTATGSVEGTLKEMTADWSVLLDGDQPRIAGVELLSLRRAGRPLPPMPEGKHLILANGDRIPLERPRLVGERLRFRHPDLAAGKETELPLPAVAVLWLVAPDQADGPQPRQQLRYRLTHESRGKDQVVLRNGDIREGIFGGLDEQKAEIEVEKKQVAVNLDRVAYMTLSTELAESLKPKGPFARVVLSPDQDSPGGRMSLLSATCTDGRTLQGTTVFGSKLSVPLTRVAALDVYQGKAVYLSDLKPRKYEHIPFLDCRWPYVPDGSVTGCELRLGGSTFDKGLGMHSHSRLSYDLGGVYRRFEAAAGLDDQTGRKGSVRIKVWGDGKPLDIAPDRELTAANGPLAVSVSVAGVKELILEVEFGQAADVEDHVNWVNARLVK
jgi:hypothetical protein